MFCFSLKPRSFSILRPPQQNNTFLCDLWRRKRENICLIKTGVRNFFVPLWIGTFCSVQIVWTLGLWAQNWVHLRNQQGRCLFWSPMSCWTGGRSEDPWLYVMRDGSCYLLHEPDRPSTCSSVSQHRKGNGDVILEVPASFLHAVVLQHEGKVLW